MYTLNYYNKNPNFIDEIKSDYDCEKVFNICFNFEIMKLQRKLDCTMMIMEELVDTIKKSIDYINNLFTESYLSDEIFISDFMYNYIIYSLVDIIAYRGETFKMFHEDIYYPIINCFHIENKKNYNKLIDYIYNDSYTSIDYIILKFVSSLYNCIPIFNCRIIDFTTDRLIQTMKESWYLNE